MVLHGPHHSAPNSTSTGSSLSNTSCSKFRSVTVGRGMAISRDERRGPYGARPSRGSSSSYAARGGRKSACNATVSKATEGRGEQRGDRARLGRSEQKAPRGQRAWRAQAGLRNRGVERREPGHTERPRSRTAVPSAAAIPPSQEGDQRGAAKPRGTDSGSSASRRTISQRKSQACSKPRRTPRAHTKRGVLLVPCPKYRGHEHRRQRTH